MRRPAIPAIAVVWVAAGAVVAGFGLVAYTWDRVSTLTIVAKQVPYIVSSGFTGLGLIVLGAALLVVSSRRTDDLERQRRSDALIEALEDIRRAVGDDRSRTGA